MKVYSSLLPKVASVNEQQPSSGTGFGKLFNNLLQQSVNDQTTASQLSTQLALGETDDVQAVMVAAEKASLSWQLLQAVQGKLLEAYQEVMRMQL